MRVDAIVVLLLTAALTAAPAQAYVDPGTGGMLVQLLTGGVAGVLVLIRLFWSRIISIFRRGDSTHGGPQAGSRLGH